MQLDAVEAGGLGARRGVGEHARAARAAGRAMCGRSTSVTRSRSPNEQRFELARLEHAGEVGIAHRDERVAARLVAAALGAEQRGGGGR